MNNLLKIVKKRDDLFELIEFDPRDEQNTDKQKFLQDFSRCGIIVDTHSDDNHWISLSSGNYDLVEKKFNHMVEKFKQSTYPELADNLRLYDISKLPAEDIEKILTHSGVIKTFLDKTPCSYVQGSSFDDAVVVD